MNLSSISDTERECHCETLREELPVLRAKARITQDELSCAIGISRQTYCAIENGKRKMSWTVFLALLAYFQNDISTKLMIENMVNNSIGSYRLFGGAACHLDGQEYPMER